MGRRDPRRRPTVDWGQQHDNDSADIQVDGEACRAVGLRNDRLHLMPTRESRRSSSAPFSSSASSASLSNLKATRSSSSSSSFHLSSFFFFLLVVAGWGGGVVSVAHAAGSGDYPLGLQNLHVSHGQLDPPFDQMQRKYTLALDHPYESISLTPQVPDSPAYRENGSNYPLVEITWDGKADIGPQSSSAAVFSEGAIPGDGRSVQAKIRVQNPNDPSSKVDYNVKIVQNLAKEEPHVGLRALDVTDNNGRRVEVMAGEELDSFIAFVDPQAKAARLQVTCAEGDSVSVDGGFVANEGKISLPRESWKHRQIVEIECYRRERGFTGAEHSRVYVLSIMSDRPLTDIPQPKLVVAGVGQECQFDFKHEKYTCPMPSNSNGSTRVISYTEPTIRYTIESSGNIQPDGKPNIQVRLLHGLPSISFSVLSDNLYVVGWSGQHTKSWPVTFDGSMLMAWMSTLGWFLAVTLVTLLCTLMGVLIASNALGIGAPFGAVEIASNSAFLLQFFTFSASFLKEQGALQSVVHVIKWVTIFWPLPWEVDSHTLSYNDVSSVVGTGNASGVIGNVLDLHNAMGCLFWSAMIMGFTTSLRAGVAWKYRMWDRTAAVAGGHTFPHRLLFGHWEARCMHFLIFPVMTASCMILAAPNAFSDHARVPVAWEGAALTAVALCLAWITYTYTTVRKAVLDEKVTWVWNAGVRENGEIEDEEGYWSDVVCDQLNTHAVNRGLVPPWLLSWKWSSTVADIEPMVIRGERPRTFRRRSRDRSGAGSQHSASLLGADGDIPLGGTSTPVEVLKTRAPGVVCPGQRMVAGLVRCEWIDILFTYEGLTHFHSQVAADTAEPFEFALTAKCSQLQGPFAAGRYCFFFDGVRVPFIKIEDSMFRSLVGICLGVCLAIQLRATATAEGFLGTQGLTSLAYMSLATAYGLVGVGGLGSLAYVSSTLPYTRKTENFLLVMTLAVLSLASFSFMAYAVAHQSPSVFSLICLWLTAIACVVLALYSILVIFSLIMAIISPPLEETRFLERLANCVCTIADHAEGWAVNLPAYSKRPARSVKAVCQYLLPSKPPSVSAQQTLKPKLLVSLIPTEEDPTIEFPVIDIKRAVETGNLRVPVACLFAPSNSFLRYKSENVYAKDDSPQLISHFLQRETLTKTCAKDLCRHITNVVEKHKASNRKQILSLTIIPPTNNTMVMENDSSADSNSTAATTSEPSSAESPLIGASSSGAYFSSAMTSEVDSMADKPFTARSGRSSKRNIQMARR